MAVLDFAVAAQEEPFFSLSSCLLRLQKHFFSLWWWKPWRRKCENFPVLSSASKYFLHACLDLYFTVGYKPLCSALICKNYSIFQLLLDNGEGKLVILVQMSWWLSYSPFPARPPGPGHGSASNKCSTSGFTNVSCVEDINI